MIMQELYKMIMQDWITNQMQSNDEIGSKIQKQKQGASIFLTCSVSQLARCI